MMLDKKACSIFLFLIFSNFIFGPLVLYLSNLDLFWFDISKILIGSSIAAICAYSFLLGIFFILKRINPKIIQPAAAVIFALSSALYIQGNFLVKQYGVLNGVDINWAKYKDYGIFNTLIWIGLIVIILFIYYKLKDRAIKGFAMASILLVLVQGITLGVMMLSYDSPEKPSPALSGDGLLSLSVEKNVVIFVLDTFDATVFDKILESNPEYKDKFEGFTYYDNIIGIYPTTKVAIPQILTGQVFLNKEPFKDYINRIYGKSPLFKLLKNENYDIRVNTSEYFLPNNGGDYIDNFYISSYTIASYPRLFKNVYSIVAFRYAPHFMKRYFVTDTNSLESLKINIDIDQHLPNYSWKDKLFFDDLINKGIKVDSQKPAFRFIHLYGAHPPYLTDKSLRESNTANETSAAEGALFIVQEYIKQLKELNIYEQTDIVIMADHGFYEIRQKPVFLVKKALDSKEFEVSHVFGSYEDIQSVFCELIKPNLNPKDVGFINIGYVDNLMHKYYNFNWDENWKADYLPTIREYEFYNNASVSNAVTGRKVYNANNKQELINLDLKLDNKLKSFNLLSNPNYRVGFYEKGENGVWSKEYSRFVFDYHNKDNLVFKINYSKLCVEYISKLYFNDIYICDIEPNEPILLPKELMDKSGRQTITIETKNLKSPFELGLSKDENKYGIYIFEARLAKEKWNSLKFNEDIAEINRDNIEGYMASGWNGVEENGVWSTGEATLKFEHQGKKQMSIKIQGMALTPDSGTQIYLNDHLIANFEDGKIITFPAEYINSNGKQELKFITPNATSPKELGVSNDERQLGIFINKITFSLGK